MATGDDCEALRDAGRIADDVLFPASLAVDAADAVPAGHLDLLAERGFYGLAAPTELSTLDLPDYPAVQRVVEILAGGCLTTAFVWIQHHGAVMAAADTENEALRERYLVALAAGRTRAGLAVGAATRPGPPLLRATAVDGGWIFDGTAPWVSGWGMVDLLYTAGRDEHDRLVFALLDAEDGTSLGIEPLDMVAVRASRTVTLSFTGHFVPHDRVTSTVAHATYLEGDAESVRFTGSLALGVAGRAISLLAEDTGALADALAGARDRLLQAGPDDVPAARAATAELAMRAAAALAVHTGSRSVLTDAHAQRLIREAAFLLVFGTRPAIRAALLGRFTGGPPR